MASNIDLYSDRKVNAKKKENMGRLNGLLSLFSAVTLLISEKVHTVNKIIQAVTFLPNNCQSVKKSTEILVILHYKNMVPWPLGWPCVFLFFFFFQASDRMEKKRCKCPVHTFEVDVGIFHAPLLYSDSRDTPPRSECTDHRYSCCLSSYYLTGWLNRSRSKINCRGHTWIEIRLVPGEPSEFRSIYGHLKCPNKLAKVLTLGIFVFLGFWNPLLPFKMMESRWEGWRSPLIRNCNSDQSQLRNLY